MYLINVNSYLSKIIRISKRWIMLDLWSSNFHLLKLKELWSMCDTFHMHDDIKFSQDVLHLFAYKLFVYSKRHFFFHIIKHLPTFCWSSLWINQLIQYVDILQNITISNIQDVNILIKKIDWCHIIIFSAVCSHTDIQNKIFCNKICMRA